MKRLFSTTDRRTAKKVLKSFKRKKIGASCRWVGEDGNFLIEVEPKDYRAALYILLKKSRPRQREKFLERVRWDLELLKDGVPPLTIEVEAPELGKRPRGNPRRLRGHG